MTEGKIYNIQFLKKSRLKEGDIFAVSIDNTYIFGRVIKTNLPFSESPFGGSNLIYLYDIRASGTAIDYSQLTPEHLLIPPLYVSTVLWAKGYAMKVANEPVSGKTLLARHCFYSTSHKAYYDEKGNELAEKTEPCGEWACVVSIQYIDNKISDALHIVRASAKK